MAASHRVPGIRPPVGSSPIADSIRERRGARGLTPLDETLLHVPEIANGWNTLLGAVRTRGNLPADVRETMILRVAALNHAAFEWIHHENVARDAGLTTAQLSFIRNTSIQPSSLLRTPLTPLQAAALGFADSSTKDITVPDHVFSVLRSELRTFVDSMGEDISNKEEKLHLLLVEAASVVATYNMVSRFLVSLDVAGMSDDPVPWPADRQEHTVLVPSCSLYVETLTVNPTAPWLVLVNSLLTDTTLWSTIIPTLLSNGYNVTTFDQRGHGRSTIPSPPFCTMPELADDIAALLTYLHIPRVHALIGVSQGGATTLSFAIRHACKTSCIIACDTQPMSPASNGPAWDARIHLAQTEGMHTLAVATARRWFPSGSAYHPDGGVNAHVICDMIARTDVLGFEAGARALQGYDLLEAGLLRSRMRTLLVAGEKDGALPIKMEELRNEWVRDGGDVELAIVEGSGHLPMLDNPEKFLEVVLKFLQGC